MTAGRLPMIGIRRRPGATLMEVLIAILILALGMLAIMALFPIGAVNMARAITQDRATTHGVNSDNVFRYYWAQAWNDPSTGTPRVSTKEAYGFSQEPMLYLLEHHTTYRTLLPTSSQPSFPVLIDPVGWQNNVPGSPNQYFVAGLPFTPMRTTLRRCINLGPPGNPGYPFPWSPLTMVPPYPLNVPLQPPPVSYAGPPPVEDPPGVPPNPPYPSNIRATIRLTTLQDDLSLATANDPSNNPPQYMQGEPAIPAGQIERGGRYNVAWLIQRPRNDFPAEVTLKVLVYAGRSPTDTPSPETPYPLKGPALPGEKLIRMDITGQAMPSLRRGGWVALCRPIVPDPAAGQPPPFTPYPSIE